MICGLSVKKQWEMKIRACVWWIEAGHMNRADKKGQVPSETDSQSSQADSESGEQVDNKQTGLKENIKIVLEISMT